MKTLLFLNLILIFLENVHLQPSCLNDYGRNNYRGVCMDVNDCTGAALSGNCTSGNNQNTLVCCIQDTSLTINEHSLITKSLFLKLVGNTTRNNAMYNYFVESMNLANISNEYRAAAYFATLVGESGYFRMLESSVADNDYDADIGNDGFGDGSVYRGRGGILLHGKFNYLLAENGVRGSFISINF